MIQDMILVLDLGAKNNAAIARKIRELGVYSEIHPHNLNSDQLSALANVKGIILNGGPGRLSEDMDASQAVYDFNVPVLSVNHKGKSALNLDEWADSDTAMKEQLSKFIFSDCKTEKNWSMSNFISDQVELLRRQIGNGHVLLALSGGVDSSVVAALLIKAVGKQLTCVHVNHGLLRKGEPEEVVSVFREQLGANLVYVDAVDRFLAKLESVSDPETKRRIIGAEFIRVFEEEARKIGIIDFLAQGTIYSDVIESGSLTAKPIKAHHNVGGLPDDLTFELVEPLKMLFKDEVRACGLELGLPESMVYRQPFPGPGLGVRCLGVITRERLEAVRESDAILRQEFTNNKIDAFQFFTIIPDIKSTGVRNDERTHEYPVIIRAINSIDVMTANVVPLPFDLLSKITARITSEVKGVNRVLYDLTPKPCGTIEWE